MKRQKVTETGRHIYRLWIWEFVDSPPRSMTVLAVYWGAINDVPDGFIQIVKVNGNNEYLSTRNIERFIITPEEEAGDESKGEE